MYKTSLFIIFNVVFKIRCVIYTYPSCGISTFCGIDKPISEKCKSETLLVNVTSGFAANSFVRAAHAVKRTTVSPIVLTFSRISVQSFIKLYVRPWNRYTGIVLGPM